MTHTDDHFLLATTSATPSTLRDLSRCHFQVCRQTFFLSLTPLPHPRSEAEGVSETPFPARHASHQSSAFKVMVRRISLMSSSLIDLFFLEGPLNCRDFLTPFLRPLHLRNIEDTIYLRHFIVPTCFFQPPRCSKNHKDTTYRVRFVPRIPPTPVPRFAALSAQSSAISTFCRHPKRRRHDIWNPFY